MKDLIEALQIFAKYAPESRWPTNCEHDVLYIMDVTMEAVSPKDRARLDELGFVWDASEEVWFSFRFGSC